MQFTKRPITIEAFRLPAEHDDDVSPFHAWAAAVGFTAYTSEVDGSMSIETLEGTMTAEPGDWIIKGVKGEFYPCKPDVFVASYLCARCKGTGRYETHCEDPQCGDSTWDHECGDGSERCPCIDAFDQTTRNDPEGAAK